MSSGYQEPGGGTASPSTGTAVGSKPIRAWLKVLRNVDITAEPGYGSTFIPKLKTPFEILSTALRLQNPAQTFYTNIESAALAANQSIKVPIITATESGNKKDEVVLLKQGQSLENKTFPTFFDVTETAAPANPSAGTLRIYANSTTHELTQRNSSGTEVKLSDGSGGGGGAPTDAQYLTLGVNATLTGERVLTGSGRISITDAGPGVTATLDIPTGAIVDSYIGSHTSSKISITTKGQLNSNIVYTDQANTIGDFDQTFRTSRLILRDESNTHSYIHAGSELAANRIVLWPLLTANDIPVMETHATTLFNKTISGASNTLTNIGDSAISAHTSTKITITNKSLLNSQIAYKDESNWMTNSHVADGTFNWAKVSKSGSILDDVADVVITSVASQDILHRNGSSQWVNLAKGSNNTLLGVNGSGNLAYTTVADANIASHTSTKITITSKGQLNSAILYSDVDNALGSHYVDVTEIAAPANPGAGVLRIYANSTTHELTQRDSSGTEKKFSDGSGGSGAPTNSTYLVLSSDGTLSAERIATASSRVTITDGGANSTATFDIGSGSIVDAYIGTHTSTKISITNKSLLNSAIVYNDQANVFGANNQTIPIANLLLSNNGNTGAFGVQASLTGTRVWSMPNASTNVMGHDTTDTMTNKTFSATGTGNVLSNVGDTHIASHTSTKITITSKGQLNSAILYNDADNNLGAHYLDVSEIAAPGNPAANHLRLYMHSTDEHLKVKNSAGAVVDLFDVVHGHAFTDLTGSIDTGQIDPNTITDSHIAAHTSTKITITNKGQLNSAILYNDVDNALGAHYFDIDEIAAPGNPAAGKLRIFANSATGELSQKNSSGTVVKMSDGSGGGGAPTGAQYITLATDGTLSAERVLTAGQNFTFADPGAGNALTPAIKNIGKAAYDMWRVSSDYFARDNATGTVTTNTNFRTLLNAVNTAMATGGSVIGGTIHLRQGIYILDGSQVLGASATPSYRVRIIGEGIDLTTIKRSGSAGTMFTPECNFEFENLTLDGDAIGTQLISCGEPVRGRCTNVKIARHTDIGIWYGNSLISFITDRCIFEDPRGTQDQFAYTCTEYGIVRGCTFDRLNTVFTSAVRGGSCLTSGGGDNILITHNRVMKADTFQKSGFGCSIEAWDRSYNNITITDNILVNAEISVGAGPITQWDNNMTIRNVVIDGNVCNGAEITVQGPDSNWTNDSGKVRNVTISNNIINKSWDTGLRLYYLSGQINVNGNTIVDSNIGGLTNTGNNHGCVHIYNCTDMSLTGNKIYMTASATNNNPYGLRIDTTDRITAKGNTFYNTTANPSYTAAGTNTNKEIQNNTGINDDIVTTRQIDLATGYIRIHGNDGIPIPMINAEGGGSPNQHFHILPDLHKQTSATDNQFFFGYNAEFTAFSWNSKWVNGVNPGGANKEYFKIDAGNNLIRFRTPIFIGDNQRLKLNETNLSAEREFTFPDSAGEVSVITATQTVTNKTIRSKDNNLVGVAQNPVYKRWGAYQPITATSGTTAAAVGKLEGILANHVPTGPGTNTNTWDSVEGLLTNLITTSTINQNAGLVSPTGSIAILRRERAAKMIYRGKIDTVAGSVARLYFGVSSNSAPNISDTIANGDSLVIVGFKSSATNYEIYHNDGTAAHATTTVTGTIAKNTSFHTIEIEWTAGGNVVVTFDGTSQTISSDIPATTTNLFFHCLAQNASAAIRTHSIVGVWVESE